MSFSTLKDEHLKRLGILRGNLSFQQTTPGSLQYLNEHSNKLKDQLLEIYDRVNMDVRPIILTLILSQS